MCLGFCGSMPVITIITFFALCLRYVYEKYYFFRYCRIPKTFDEALDLEVSGLIPYAIIIHFAFSIWMFGSSGIFQFDASFFDDIVNIILYRLPIHRVNLSRKFNSSQKECSALGTIQHFSFCSQLPGSLNKCYSTVLQKDSWMILKVIKSFQLK